MMIWDDLDPIDGPPTRAADGNRPRRGDPTPPAPVPEESQQGGDDSDASALRVHEVLGPRQL
jgi:hypothetical protein